VAAVQPLTTGSTRGHIVKQYVTDLEGKSWDPLLPETRAGEFEDVAYADRLTDATLIDRLPLDPQNVIVIDNRTDTLGDVDKVNIYTHVAQRLERGSERFFGYRADLKGEVRTKQEVNFSGDNVYIAQWIRNPKSGAWEEHFRSYAKDRSITEVVAFTPDPNIVYVAATPNGADKTAIYEYDIAQRKLLDPVFAHKLFEASPSIMQSRAPVSSDARARIVGWSDDFKYALVEKSGPRLPPEYYLLTEGTKLALLGKSRPWIDPASLGETRLVQYAARDGLMIPAFLTLPPKGQFEPHGGPWARDELDWDISGWVQYFASRGYAVLQPQFRGSEGWGQKLWRAGDGEWGGKMQDDKDDGVKWLVDQHIADPARVAIFGYSYGGYAALAASIRPNGLYQCAISGAGAGDLAAISEATFDNRFQREFQHPTIKGLDALAHAKEAKIPVLLYHGDRDQTVDIEQSRKFAAALKSAGKPVKLVEIKDMGHQYVFMTPAMLEEQLNLVDGFLKSDCKPGGL
jgi:dipeptidyl aminopeptidase/acylaminoacyl peptidase